MAVDLRHLVALVNFVMDSGNLERLSNLFCISLHFCMVFLFLSWSFKPVLIKKNSVDNEHLVWVSDLESYPKTHTHFGKPASCLFFAHGGREWSPENCAGRLIHYQKQTKRKYKCVPIHFTWETVCHVPPCCGASCWASPCLPRALIAHSSKEMSTYSGC